MTEDVHLQGDGGFHSLHGGGDIDYFSFGSDTGVTDIITNFDPNGETIDQTAFGSGYTIAGQTQNGADL